MPILPADTVVCPKCGFAFRQSSGMQLLCPRPECGFAWTPDGLTEAKAVSTEGREAEYFLKVVSGDTPGLFALELDQPLTVGREPNCGIRLGNLQVSRRHTEVHLREGKVRVKDLGSSSGTLIDREAIQEGGQDLQLGQRLIVGGVVLQLEVRLKPKTVHSSHVDSQRIIRDSVSLEVLVKGRAADGFEVWDKAISIGRQESRDVVLRHSMVSRKHAKIIRDGEAIVVLDTGSGGGTFVNGVAVLRKEVQKGDRMQIGPFLFVFDGKRFTRQFELTKISLVALELTKGSGRDKYLSDVSLAVNPGEFVGVLGPSGAGKSTLLNALNGLRPATSGNVLINGLDLYENFDQWRSAIGFVPQDDIVHRELTAEEAITYAARLRLPADSSTDDIRAVVDDAIKTVRLEHRRKASIATLSGGERKRVSVAVELVGSPGLLFLDEPTAALDPGTAGALMRTFRAMADQGRTLICTTHIMENLDLFDKITVLVRGRLAFFGLPVECMKHFGISRFADLYEKLESRPPEYWENLFRNSKSHATYVAEPIEPYRHTLIGNARPRGDARPRAGRWDQFFTLTSRYLRVFFADRRNAAWLLAQPLIVALLVNWVCTSFPLAAFLTSISCLWFGCNQSAREIVRERAIFARERMVGQSVGSYFASKAVVLTGVAVLQTILMVTFLYALTGCSGALAPQFAVFLVSGLFGTLLGLFVSTLVRSEMAAVTIVPLALIPQIILAGALVPVPYMNGMARALSCLCPTRWTNHAMDCSILHERTVSDALMKSEFVSIQNVFSQYDLRKAADLSSFLTEYGGKELDLVVSGTIALMVIALFCVLAVAVSLFVLHTRRPET